MRILKDFYGNTTAPRGLWKDVDHKFKELGGINILGDPCVWIWVIPNVNPKNALDKFKTIGYCGGHVDDFHRSGDEKIEAWLQILDGYLARQHRRECHL